MTGFSHSCFTQKMEKEMNDKKERRATHNSAIKQQTLTPVFLHYN